MGKPIENVPVQKWLDTDHYIGIDGNRYVIISHSGPNIGRAVLDRETYVEVDDAKLDAHKA